MGFFALFFIPPSDNIRRSFSMKKETADGMITGTGSHADVTRHQGGLLEAANAIANAAANAAASRLSRLAGNDETSGHDIIYEKDGVPYIDSAKVYDPVCDRISDITKKNNRDSLDSDFIKLVESVTGS